MKGSSFPFKKSTSAMTPHWVRHVLGRLLAGLAAIIPIIGTVLLLIFIYRALYNLGDNFLNFFAKRHVSFPVDEPVKLLIPILVLYGVGHLVTNRFGGQILGWIDRTILRLPLLGFIYSAQKQFVDAVRNLGGDRKFKSVAFVEYPSPGCRLLGFVTGEYHDKQNGKNITTVFVPTSPNPMTGFIILVDDDKLIPSDMTPEQAGKMILSAGLVTPEHATDTWPDSAE